MMNFSDKNRLGELIKCSICFEIFKEPKILPCKHTFCRSCLSQVQSNSCRIRCPLCSQQFNVPENGFETDFKTNQLIDCYHELANEPQMSYHPSAPPEPPMSFQNNSFHSANEPMLQSTSYDPENEANSQTRDSKYKKTKFYKYLSFGFITISLGLVICLIVFFATKNSCNSLEFSDSGNCIPKKQYLESCFSSSQCSDIQSLFCINKTCECYSVLTYYNFENKKCTNKKHESDECSFSNECLNPMQCRSKKCQCESNEYFDEIKMNCVNKTLFNSPCETSKTCHEELGLMCQNNLCQCESTKKFWSINDTRCIDQYKYGQIGCKTNHQCSVNLICNLNENNCSCPLISKRNMCDCERNENNYTYWNGESCVPAGENMSKCKNDYECRYPRVCLDTLSKCSNSYFMKLLFKASSSHSLISSGLIQISFLAIFFYFFMKE